MPLRWPCDEGFSRRQRAARSSPTTAPSSMRGSFRARLRRELRARRSAPPARGHLGPLVGMAPRATPVHSRINLFTPHWTGSPITPCSALRTIKSAIAPGYLGRAWDEKRTSLLRVQHGVDAHSGFLRVPVGALCDAQGNLLRSERCREPRGLLRPRTYVRHRRDAGGSRAGLDYFQAHFSPYQFTQYRIMEFPRYRTFAQSFPNTVPFSEAIGFISRMAEADGRGPDVLRDRARARASVVGPPAHRRARCRAPT